MGLGLGGFAFGTFTALLVDRFGNVSLDPLLVWCLQQLTVMLVIAMVMHTVMASLLVYVCSGNIRDVDLSRWQANPDMPDRADCRVYRVWDTDYEEQSDTQEHSTELQFAGDVEGDQVMEFITGSNSWTRSDTPASDTPPPHPKEAALAENQPSGQKPKPQLKPKPPKPTLTDDELRELAGPEARCGRSA
jgi:hypothetical protein